MNIEFDSYKQKLNDCRPALDGLAQSINLEGLKNERERYAAMQEAPGFWDDPEKSQKIVVKAKQTETKIEKYEAMCSLWEDLITICEMAAELDDDSAKALQECFNEFYRIPIITRLVASEEKFGSLTWTVETDHGPVKFRIRNRHSDIKKLPVKGWLFL